MTSALAVANAIIKKVAARESSVSNLKLQKLLYFAQGFHSVTNTDDNLFTDSIEAWKYGPVVPSVYHKFKIYLAGPIPNNHPFTSSETLSDKKNATVDWVIDNLGKYTAMQLSNFSHAQNSPWDKVFNSNDSSEIIEVSELKSYFLKLLVPKNPT